MSGLKGEGRVLEWSWGRGGVSPVVLVAREASHDWSYKGEGGLMSGPRVEGGIS